MVKKEAEEWEIKIKEIYQKMMKIQEANHPDHYLLPISVWNEIMKDIAYFQRALKNVRDERDNWKTKYQNEKENKTKD